MQITVSSAVVLTDRQKKKLEDSFKKKFKNNKLVFDFLIKEELIAGLSINVNGKLYDTSFRARLDRIAEKI